MADWELRCGCGGDGGGMIAVGRVACQTNDEETDSYSFLCRREKTDSIKMTQDGSKMSSKWARARRPFLFLFLGRLRAMPHTRICQAMLRAKQRCGKAGFGRRKLASDQMTKS